jgi:hypothetical protein
MFNFKAQNYRGCFDHSKFGLNFYEGGKHEKEGAKSFSLD